MSSFNRFSPQAFVQWETVAEIMDARFPFWRIANDAFFTPEGKQYDPDNGENWIIIPFWDIVATGTRRPFAAGDGEPEISALGLLGYGGAIGNATMFPVSVSGAGSSGGGVVITAGGNGSVSIPFSITGTGYTNERGNGSIQIPFVEITARQSALSEITLHRLVVNGSGYSGQIGNCDVSLPRILVSGIVLNSKEIVNTGNAFIPLLTLSGAGKQTGSIGVCSISIPVILINSTGKALSQSTISSDVILRNERKRRYL